MAEWKLELFVRDVIMPLAIESNALIIGFFFIGVHVQSRIIGIFFVGAEL